MGLFNMLFGKPPKRKSSTYADWYQPAAQPLNCSTSIKDKTKCRAIDPWEDAFYLDCIDEYAAEEQNRYDSRIENLKSEGRTFFVIYSFRGHDEGAEILYRICESREQMESVPRSYDDWTDSYIPHELVLNVVDGESVDTPPEWWSDYENNFQENEKLRQWQASGSSTYRL